MKVFGNPERKKRKLQELVKNLTFDDKYLIHTNNFRKEILENINKNMVLLDIGQSMRDDFNKIDCAEKKTLDINVYENYPDFQFDLSEEIEIENTELNENTTSLYALRF